MRIASILAAGSFACGLALAADRSESITYVDGNLTGVTRQSSGALVYSAPESMQLKAGLATLAVPYAGISKAGLSAPQEHSSGVPLYKVWALHKHFAKTETQLLTVDYKDDHGEARTMTLELGKSAASTVLNAIKQHNPSVEVAALGDGESSAVAPALASRLTSEPKHKSSKADSKSNADDETKAAGTRAASPDKDAWWGDKIWKTSRNAETWEKSSANAPE